MVVPDFLATAEGSQGVGAVQSAAARISGPGVPGLWGSHLERGVDLRTAASMIGMDRAANLLGLAPNRQRPGRVRLYAYSRSKKWSGLFR